MIGLNKSAFSNSQTPTADLKPTIDAPVENVQTKMQTLNASNLSESLYGDVAGTNSSVNKLASNLGDVMQNSTVYKNQTVTGGGSIVDGGAIMAMFEITKKAIDNYSGATNVMQAKQAEAVKAAAEQKQSEAAAASDDWLVKIKEFIKNNQAVIIAGGLLGGYLIMQGFKK